jgi:hypothetical protein
MPRSVSAARTQAEVNPLALPLIGEARRGQPTVKADDGGWILPVIAQAIDRVMSRKEAAICMGIDEGQLSRQLKGDGHLSVVRLGALGERFWVALRDELGAHFNLHDPEAEARQAAELITRGMSILLAARTR